MSSRVLRRLQGKDTFIEQIDENISDTFDSNASCGGGGARRKTLPVNPFDVLDQSHSESDTKEESEENEIVENIEPGETSTKKKKKKKKKSGKPITANIKVDEDIFECDDTKFDEDLYGFESNGSNQLSTNVSNNFELASREIYSSAISVKIKNLNANNELKKIFGTRIVDNDNSKRRNRGRVCIKTYTLVNPKETWPPLGKTGISMKIEKVNGRNIFTYVHSLEYQKVQRRFLYAVDTLDPDNIAAIIHTHPYHVDALIQLSDLYKLNDDLQMAAELNERALYCLEASFHPLFNIAKGNCQLDYRCQENRPFFICLFKHLIFVGQRACYQTALELCKLLLSLDFDSDPIASILCMDFYSLRCRNYTWLINAANEWETKKNLSLLPNFAYSTALAHFLLAECDQTGDFSMADKLLQDALILFPGVLIRLVEKCSVQCDTVVTRHRFFTSDAELGQSRSLVRLIELYVNRAYHDWKNPKILPWLERNVHTVLERVNSGDPFVLECSEKRSKRYPSTPRNVLRHIILSDVKEVTSTIASDITTPILSFDPLPPIDSVDIYTRQERVRPSEHSPTLSLFFRSLLPNFNVNAQQGNRLFVDEAAIGEAAGIQVAERGAAAQVPASAAIGDTLRYSVTVLMDAIGLVLANMPLRDGDNENGNNGHHLRPELDESEDEYFIDTTNIIQDDSNIRQNLSSESRGNEDRQNTEMGDEHS